jgi:hypothetical protein
MAQHARLAGYVALCIVAGCGTGLTGGGDGAAAPPAGATDVTADVRNACWEEASDDLIRSWLITMDGLHDEGLSKFGAVQTAHDTCLVISPTPEFFGECTICMLAIVEHLYTH